MHSRQMCQSKKGNYFKKEIFQEYSRNHTCKKYEENIGEGVQQEERSCDEVETVREFTYLGDRVSAGGRCVLL